MAARPALERQETAAAQTHVRGTTRPSQHAANLSNRDEEETKKAPRFAASRFLYAVFMSAFAGSGPIEPHAKETGRLAEWN